MKTTESCSYCEKVFVEFSSLKPLVSLLEVPNTYDRAEKEYLWKSTDIVSYALVPRSIDGTKAELDVFVCMDEDDLDDIDLLTFVREIVQQELNAASSTLKINKVADSFMAPPAAIACCRQRHLMPGEFS